MGDVGLRRHTITPTDIERLWPTSKSGTANGHGTDARQSPQLYSLSMPQAILTAAGEEKTSPMDSRWEVRLSESSELNDGQSGKLSGR